MTATGKTPRARRPAAAKDAPPSAWDSFNEICSVRIELLETDPLIWREVEVPTSVTLKVLRDIVQIAMGWDWGTAPRVDATKVRLRDVLQPRKTRIDYLYDMGDSWEHRLIVTNIRPGEADLSYPRYVGGEWACPPEDCGGIPGFSRSHWGALPTVATPPENG